MQAFMVYGWREEGFVCCKKIHSCIAPLHSSLPCDDLYVMVKRGVIEWEMTIEEKLPLANLLVPNM
jgi:hypothetical protein